MDYRDDDDEDESDRGSGGAPSCTRISEWLTEFPSFVEEIHEGLECSSHGSARRAHASQEGESRLGSITSSSEADLAAYLKRNVLTYFESHCKDRGIMFDLDEIEVAAPSLQSPYAYLGNVPVGPATCPRTGTVITAPSARDGADGDPDEFVELEMSPQVSQLYGISEEFGSQLKEGEF